MKLSHLFRCLADETRLTCTLLIFKQTQLCVAELVYSTGCSQPKISRHLAQLRACGLLSDTRREQWVYYSLHPELPSWAYAIVSEAYQADKSRLESMLKKLHGFSGGPAQY